MSNEDLDNSEKKLEKEFNATGNVHQGKSRSDLLLNGNKSSLYFSQYGIYGLSFGFDALNDGEFSYETGLKTATSLNYLYSSYSASKMQGYTNKIDGLLSSNQILSKDNKTLFKNLSANKSNFEAKAKVGEQISKTTAGILKLDKNWKAYKEGGFSEVNYADVGKALTDVGKNPLELIRTGVEKYGNKFGYIDDYLKNKSIKITNEVMDLKSYFNNGQYEGSKRFFKKNFRKLVPKDITKYADQVEWYTKYIADKTKGALNNKDLLKNSLLSKSIQNLKNFGTRFGVAVGVNKMWNSISNDKDIFDNKYESIWGRARDFGLGIVDVAYSVVDNAKELKNMTEARLINKIPLMSKLTSGASAFFSTSPKLQIMARGAAKVLGPAIAIGEFAKDTWDIYNAGDQDKKGLAFAKSAWDNADNKDKGGAIGSIVGGIIGGVLGSFAFGAGAVPGAALGASLGNMVGGFIGGHWASITNFAKKHSAVAKGAAIGATLGKILPIPGGTLAGGLIGAGIGKISSWFSSDKTKNVKINNGSFKKVQTLETKFEKPYQNKNGFYIPPADNTSVHIPTIANKVKDYMGLNTIYGDRTTAFSSL